MVIQTSFGRCDYSRPWEEISAQQDINWKTLENQDARAKKAGQLVGRYITQGIADGRAVYVIVKENQKTVRIAHVTGLGDDYMIPYWGSGTSIKKDFALQNLNWKDLWTTQA